MNVGIQNREALREEQDTIQIQLQYIKMKTTTQNEQAKGQKFLCLISYFLSCLIVALQKSSSVIRHKVSLKHKAIPYS